MARDEERDSRPQEAWKCGVEDSAAPQGVFEKHCCEEAGCDHASPRSLCAVRVSEIEHGKGSLSQSPRRRALFVSAAPVTLGHHGCHIRKVLKWFLFKRSVSKAMDDDVDLYADLPLPPTLAPPAAPKPAVKAVPNIALAAHNGTWVRAEGHVL